MTIKPTIIWAYSDRYSKLEQWHIGNIINMCVDSVGDVGIATIQVLMLGTGSRPSSWEDDRVIEITLQPDCDRIPVCNVSIEYPSSLTVSMCRQDLKCCCTIKSMSVSNKAESSRDADIIYAVVDKWINGFWTQEVIRVTKWKRLHRLYRMDKLINEKIFTLHPIMKYLFD